MLLLAVIENRTLKSSVQNWFIPALDSMTKYWFFFIAITPVTAMFLYKSQRRNEKGFDPAACCQKPLIFYTFHPIFQAEDASFCQQKNPPSGRRNGNPIKWCGESLAGWTSERANLWIALFCRGRLFDEDETPQDWNVEFPEQIPSGRDSMPG